MWNVVNEQHIPGLELALAASTKYEDRCWFSFLIKVARRRPSPVVEGRLIRAHEELDRVLMELENMTADRDSQRHMKGMARDQRDKVTKKLSALSEGPIKWIKCDVRKPEAEERVLVRYFRVWEEHNPPVVTGARLCKIFDDMDHLFWINDNGESMRGTVTHWMPMIELGVDDE